VFIATQLNSTELNSTRQCEQQLTQFVGRDVTNKNTTDLAERCSSGSVELSSVQLSSVELCRYKHPFMNRTSAKQLSCTMRKIPKLFTDHNAYFNF